MPVDDKASVRMSTADRPDERGREVVEVALMRAGAEVFDLLVIDHLMPGMTGVEFAGIVRR